MQCRRWVVLAGVGLAQLALAGGGPETTLLVVNASSQASLQVANVWSRLRDLPDYHLLWLESLPPGDTIDVETFRRAVLAPIRAHLEATGLEGEIDLVAYSAGFPYAVNFRADELSHGLKPDRLRGEAGSLTGMTFFTRKVEAGRVDYLTPYANAYARRPVTAPVTTLSSLKAGSQGRAAMPAADLAFESARGFRSRYLWGRGAETAAMGNADRYRLAAMLGYAGLRGNSVPEIERYLVRAASSDGTRPKGTVYLMLNRDVRSRTRQPLFASAIRALGAEGQKVEVLAVGQRGQNGREPKGKDDVLGLVAGTRTFDWQGSQSEFLPGAIAESLTSYGGHFSHGPQTKLSAFLRHGAAGSSGAVREPYALIEKFPLPHMHAFYAQGVSLAEAFFLSVLSPYQLLVVGEPLARPFAQFATVSLPDWPTQAVRGGFSVLPQVDSFPGRGIERVELWVNGLLMDSAMLGEALKVDTRRLPDGVHDVRVVAVEAGPIETRSFAKARLQVDNVGRRVAMRMPARAVRWNESFELEGEAIAAHTVRVEHLGRLVGTADAVRRHRKLPP